MRAGDADRSARDSRRHPQGAAGASLISPIAHALRTSLNSILGATQILELDHTEPLTPVQKERVEQIWTAGWQLLELIDDAVALAHIAAGRLRVSVAPVALRALLRDSLAQLDDPAAPSRVRLEDDANHDATAWADPAQLKRAVARLLLGALRCDRFGGSVQIDVRQGTEGGAMIRIRGNGLAAAGQLEKMFLPFDHPPPEDAPQDVQVGLALAQKLLELMGARLQVHSDPVSGSELRILLAGAATAARPPWLAGAA